MKKIFIFLILLQILIFIHAGEKNTDITNDNDYTEIEKDSDSRYFKGDKYLKRNKNFLEALSPIPEAKDLYIKSIGWKTSAFILLGTSITTYLSSIVISGISSLIYNNPEIYPQYYDKTLSLSLFITGVSVFSLLIPEITMMIVSFVKASKKKKEAILLFNQKVKELKKGNNLSIEINPVINFVQKDHYSCGISLIFTYLF